MEIKRIVARQIFDSRGNPTVEADVTLQDGTVGRASVPSGASTGVHEAVELRDGDKNHYQGKSVFQAVQNINEEINDILNNLRADDQFLIDKRLIEADGTTNKSRLGANATLAVSLAVAKASAKHRNIPFYKQINDIAHNPEMSLPMPMMNLLNGGRHALNSSDFQEFMIIPVGAQSVVEAIKMGAEIFHTLQSILASKGFSTAVGDEGGFTFPIQSSNTEMLDLLLYACDEAGYQPSEDVVFALDVAASEFYKDDVYELKTESRSLSASQCIDYYRDIAQNYPVVSIEDGLAEDDWDGWQTLTSGLASLQLVGDDLLVTNTERLNKAIEIGAGNAILIKPNQIGTLTETLEAIQLAQKHGWNTIISHRSGETEDTSIAHIAVGTGAGQIKTGSMSRSERMAKYNELLRIEQSDESLKLANPFK